MSKVLVIGASSGGPPILLELIPKFDKSFPCPVLVVQHMPAGFTGPMAELLDSHSELTVSEAAEGDAIEPGKVLVAPAPWHMYVQGSPGKAEVALSDEPRDSSCSPRIDCTMESAAALFGSEIVGVVLSGMSAGHDCIAGAKAIGGSGGKVLVQDESTSICFGMPGGVAKLGLAEREVPVEGLYDAILDCLDLENP